MSLGKPREQTIQIKDEQSGVDRHIEDRGHQREPCFLKSPEVAHGAANPGVITALERQSARQLADHEGCRQAPENGSEQKDEDRAAVSGAVNDVFCAIGSARDHKECCGHQRPQSEANRFFVIGNGGYEDFLTRGASCGQFRWLPPQATHSQQLRAGWALRASGSWIPEIPLELVRSDEITGNSRRCKKNFEKFCKDQPQRAQRNTEGLLPPVVTVNHSLDPVAEMRHMKIN